MKTGFLGLGAGVALISMGVLDCGGASQSTVTVDGGGSGGAGAGVGSSGAAGSTAGNGGTTGGTGATTGGGGGSGGSGSTTGAGGMAAGGSTGQAGSPGVVMCMPGVEQALITDCGYPRTDGSSLAKVTFSESEVLRAIQPEGKAPQGIVRLFYNDEHALTLGVRQVVVKTAAGSMSTDYPVSPLTTNPGSVTNAQLGTTALSGDDSGLDQSLRPMWPAMYVTDITSDPQSRAGDWQQGGRPTGPNDVFGTWKAAVRTVDKSVTPNTVTITPDRDPTKNSWNLGSGDQPPAGLPNQGYGAEARWTVALAAGHSYRVQVIVHDGDQNKAGGDSGEACVLFCAGGSGGGGTGGAGGGGPPPPACPQGSLACGQGGIDPMTCPAMTVCANGCCLPDTVIP